MTVPNNEIIQITGKVPFIGRLSYTVGPEGQDFTDWRIVEGCLFLYDDFSPQEKVIIPLENIIEITVKEDDPHEGKTETESK